MIKTKQDIIKVPTEKTKLVWNQSNVEYYQNVLLSYMPKLDDVFAEVIFL